MFHQQGTSLFHADRLWNHAVAAGLPTGYTARWSTTDIAWAVQTSAVAGTPSGKDIKATITTSGLFVSSMDRAGQPIDVDIVAMLYLDAVPASGQNAGGVACRVSGSTGSENAYTLTFRTVAGVGETIRLNKYVSGAVTALGNFTFSWTSATQYYLRLQAIGSTIRGKVWTPGTAEPSTWGIEVTDTDITGAGYAGLFAAHSTGDPAFGYCAVSIGGMPAPIV
jgi:hypothetical protein